MKVIAASIAWSVRRKALVPIWTGLLRRVNSLRFSRLMKLLYGW